MSNIESAMMSHGLRPQQGNTCQQVRNFVNGDANVSSALRACESQPARRDPRFELAPSLQASGTPRREIIRSTRGAVATGNTTTGEFTMVYNNRHYNDAARPKRMRPSDSPPAEALTARNDNTAPARSAVNNRQRTGNAPTVVGKSTARFDKFKAAPPTVRVRKAVFCVSNVDASISAEDLREFLQKELDVNVITIFPINSINSRNSVSTAFRICILAEDSGKLLDSDKLPKGIYVRQWVFKAPVNLVTESKSSQINPGYGPPFQRNSADSRGVAEPPRPPVQDQRIGGMASSLTVPPPGGGCWAELGRIHVACPYAGRGWSYCRLGGGGVRLALRSMSRTGRAWGARRGRWREGPALRKPLRKWILGARWVRG